MGTLHVCFADLPQYGKPTPPIDVSPLATTSNQIETLCELSDAAVDAVTATDSPSAMTQQADPNKDMPPCSLSPGANSAHSTSPTPRYERNISFFHQLSRRFGLLRSSDDPVFSAAEDDSTDSCSSTTGALPPMQRSTGASTTSSLCAPNGGDINTLSSNSNISGKSGAHLHTSNGGCLKDGHGSSSEHISCASSETSSTADIEESQEQQMCSPKADAATATKLSPTKERRSSARASFSRLQRRSTSSLRRAFESFSLSTRSLSCSGATPTAANTPVNAQQAAQRSGNGNTPIKSALKYNSNVELNRKLQAGGGGGVIGAWHTSYSASSLQLSSSAAGSSSSSSTSKSSSKGKTKPPPQRILRQPVSYTYLKGISGLPTQRVPRSAVCCQYARR
ncbi:PREDICTED: serine/arginine repetitive matrix protein 2-like [Rhagoletis zephyria]|uniref:serine/arginine repetitive matrix protein 2-like n=1 Tax=Rhagoletis zephyria TaxID=28612 RepID=UPI00081198FB|nr:PREDICTED: serine/arginine repetitive matrix protein 2-like [Rhagoletis zephyria]